MLTSLWTVIYKWRLSVLHETVHNVSGSYESICVLMINGEIGWRCKKSKSATNEQTVNVNVSPGYGKCGL
jgi:hypothetical protein